MTETVRFHLNGRPTKVVGDSSRSLLWVLRTDLGLTGTKYGCGMSLCGACSVLVNEEAVRSCKYPMRDVKGKQVVTIEGLARNGRLHPIQQAFVEHDALQCGFCTPGMILGAYDLLRKNASPSREKIVEGMEDHLCRCGSHVRVIQAIQTASRRMKGVGS
jgi:carbon-monoxide dehydrogenase small subunit